MELVKITNTGTSPVRFDGNVPVVVEPGATRIVQFEWACGQLGNPFTDDPKERAHEYMLVRTWWGYQDGFDSEDTWTNEKKPPIVVTDLDGNLVYMLIDDPERHRPLPGQDMTGNTLDTTDVLVLRATMQEQQAKLEKMEALLTLLTQPAGATVDLDPADATALSTVVAADAQKDANDAQDSPSEASSHELPKPVDTPSNAADAPAGDKATKTKLR